MLSATVATFAAELILVAAAVAVYVAGACLERVAHGDWLSPCGQMIVEHSRREPLPEGQAGVTLADRRVYGDTRISVYKRVREAG